MTEFLLFFAAWFAVSIAIAPVIGYVLRSRDPWDGEDGDHD
jgi:hypothetical protein